MSKEQVVVARKKKKKVKIFPIVNVILFLVISLIIMVPIWKVIVDSFDAKAGYGMNFLPQTFTLGGYSSILSRVALYRPFLISVVVTIALSVIIFPPVLPFKKHLFKSFSSIHDLFVFFYILKQNIVKTYRKSVQSEYL